MDSINEQIDLCVSDVNKRNILRSFIDDTIRGYKRNKLMVLYGRGGNGKSTFMNLLFNKLEKLENFSGGVIDGDVIQNIHNNSDEIENARYISNINQRLENKKLIRFSEIYDNTINSISLSYFIRRQPANYIIDTNDLDIFRNVKHELYEVVEFDKNFYPY